MFDYRKVRRERSVPIRKTLPEPVMVFDYLELKEALFAVGCFAYFGIIDVRPLVLLALLFFIIVLWPPFRERVPKGFIIHKINRYTPIKIPGFLGLSGRTKLAI
ncbi:MAG: hypothetical protein AB7G93_13335 [Bdellovibrionales bacterium]